MPTYDEVIVTFLFISYITWEYFSGVYKRNKRLKNEWLVDLISFGQLAVFKPIVMIAAFYLASLFLPQYQDAFIDLPFWMAFLIVFIPDDFSHYWIHRIAHDYPAIWPLHRTHHTTTAYQASISFRENWLWFVIMPGFWWQGLMVYYGLLEEVLLANVIIGSHDIWLHNGSNWDQALYKNKWTKKPMKLLEVFVNTPGLHRGHHGLGDNAVPYGNYAQTLFIWDVLFGTAVFKQGKLPKYYAVSNKEIMNQPWYYHLWWPLVPKKEYPELAARAKQQWQQHLLEQSNSGAEQ